MQLFIDNAPLIFWIASLLVLLITKKDLALWCSCGFLLSYLVDKSEWSYESTIMAYALISISITAISAAHYKKGKYPLSLAICIICVLMLCNQLGQMIEFTVFSYWFGVSLGMTMLLSLLFIPGRKEWLNDMADDIRMHRDNGISNNGRHHDGGNI
jgi:membrane-associated HD superfamily phosphohydrolase